MRLPCFAHRDPVEALAPGGIHCPTALVLGESSLLLDDARSARVIDWVKTTTDGTATVHTLPSVAHVAPEEAPERLGTLVGELIFR